MRLIDKSTVVGDLVPGNVFARIKETSVDMKFLYFSPIKLMEKII